MSIPLKMIRVVLAVLEQIYRLPRFVDAMRKVRSLKKWLVEKTDKVAFQSCKALGGNGEEEEEDG